MKKLIVYGLVVALVCSYVIPMQAMLRQKSEESAARAKVNADRRKAMEKRRMLAKQERSSTEVSAPAEQPQQASWYSRGWQAAQQGVSAAGQRVSGGLSSLKGGVQRGVASTQQAITGTLQAVRSLSWEQTIQVLTLIAGMFGLVILLYNNRGELIDTISSGVSAAASSPLTGLAAVGAGSVAGLYAIDYNLPYLVKDFTNTAKLYHHHNPEKAMEYLEIFYKQHYINLRKNTKLTDKAYNQVIANLTAEAKALKQENTQEN